VPQSLDTQNFDIYLAKMLRFTNFLSHDIRQPLETLVLVLEKALQHPGADSHARLVESLAEITTLLARIDDLIQHYFSLTRLVELYSEPVELGAVVEAFALEMRQQFADRCITLRLVDLTALGPVRLHLDAFHHVLIQLVENAMDAMPQGGVLTFRAPRQGSHVCLEVQDTGRGIPTDQLPLLFKYHSINYCRTLSCFVLERGRIDQLEGGSCFGRLRMAVAYTKPWDVAIEKNVRDFYQTLSEKDRRRFAAVQARQVGYGGVRYMAKVVGCARRTIERGLAALDTLPHDPAAGQIRRPGASRKKKSAPVHALHRP